MALLEVTNLSVAFETRGAPLTAVDRIGFDVGVGETLGIVGESGCGKSLTSLALMGLLPPNARVSASKLSFDGRDLLAMPERERRKIRGGRMAMIFQDPMTSLNPSFTVGFQLDEVIAVHEGGSGRARRAKALDLLTRVGIPDAETRLDAYPHQLSGGMCQRVMIAIAIACRPSLLIADEPTTALDVTIQAQILDLLADLTREAGMALILITHDLGVVSQMADRIAVMYAGQIVETGKTGQILRSPRHPYTAGLLACLPSARAPGRERGRLSSISGLVPDLSKRPSGCQFHPRCPRAEDICRVRAPVAVEVEEVSYRCHYA